MLQDIRLHFVVVLEKIANDLIDRNQLFIKILVNLLSHPCKKTVDVSTSLQLYTFRSVTEIVVGVFLLEFLAPLCEDAQNGWTFDSQVSAFNLYL